MKNHFIRKLLTAVFSILLFILSSTVFFTQIICAQEKGRLPEANVISTVSVKNINPAGIVMSNGQLLVVDSETATVSSYNVDSKSLTKGVQFKVKSPRGLAADNRTYWTADNTSKKVQQLDSKTGAILKSFDVPIDGDKTKTSIEGIAYYENFLWIALNAGFSSKILKMDIKTGALILSVFSDCLPRGLATDGKTLYILAYNYGKYNGSVYKMNISENAKQMYLSRQKICKTPGKEPTGAALDGKGLWISDKGSKSIQKILLP